MQLVIWWTTQAECEAIGDDMPPLVPAYLRDQYQSRYGRNGRGRLWTNEAFGHVAVDPWPETPLGRFLGEYAGGIVMRGEDMASLMGLPGIVTDLRLQRV